VYCKTFKVERLKVVVSFLNRKFNRYKFGTSMMPKTEINGDDAAEEWSTPVN